ncbi:MAG: PAS domain-containing methyl-accepting chemotaxis protein [Rhizobiaceae bacterium]|nr:PAS domain-containing methyl-accepting chemotaxis protein [Rhizobiaceae bacterium]
MIRFFQTDDRHVLNALGKSLAVIEFEPTGRIIKANSNFCALMGYSTEEIVGQHHSMFAEPAFVQSSDYKALWATLGRGEFVSHEFKRIAKGGREVFIQASYNPILSASGKVYKVVKFASDITATKLSAIGNAGMLDAISRAQAVIEFTVSGEIVTANANFLDALGYQLSEVAGRHHRLFVDPAEAQSAAYEEFWAKLRRGEFIADEFRRVGKGGRDVYIQASYNPIFDFSGQVVKIVKFATDVTGRVLAVRRLGSALGDLAKGDLVQRIAEPFIAALDPIRVSFNDSLDTLQDAMVSVNVNAEAIRTGAEQMRIAADDLARRTEQQAAALEETSAAVAEINGTVKQSSKGAEEAGHIVGRTKQDAERSGAVVAKAIEAMSLIEKSSDEIGKIIGVIDEIAFQTNLLALNAGVEAARAGEAGRGFAVVAQEVRGLAQRSAQAAKEIKELISTSRGQVEQGVDLVGETGRALEEIVVKVAEINVHVSGIVESARSQAVGLSEINVAISTLDKNTQQNAAMVEESTAAISELASEAHALNELLQAFSIGDTRSAPASMSRHGGSPARELTGRVVEAFGRTATSGR